MNFARAEEPTFFWVLLTWPYTDGKVFGKVKSALAKWPLSESAGSNSQWINLLANMCLFRMLT